MKLETIEDLFEDQIRDLYSAESQLTKALPKLAKHATTPSLKDALESHLAETHAQIERLEEIAKLRGIKLGGKKCKAMEGLIEEGAEVLEADGDERVIDGAMIAAAQRVEHYEISAYGTARAIAESLGYEKEATLLQATLDEESAADEKLSVISEGEVLDTVLSGADRESDVSRSGSTR